MLQQDQNLFSLKPPISLFSEQNEISKNSEIKESFIQSMELYESLFECLASDHSFIKKANTLRHPLIFYYGHTAVFYINKLVAAGHLNEGVDPRLESMLAIGVDEMSWDDLDNKNYDWPSPDQVFAYRLKVRKIICQIIDQNKVTLPIGQDSLAWILLMGINHEKIHLETSSVLIRELSIEDVKVQPKWDLICPTTAEAPKNYMVDIHGGEVHLGLPENYDYYSWDLESGKESQKVRDFSVSAFLVSNYEYHEFVQAGGYQNPSYWTQEGMAWLEYSKALQPRFWLKTEDSYQYRTMLQNIDMPWDWPAEVNYLEAKAFCNWKSSKLGKTLRLISEEEWLLMSERERPEQESFHDSQQNINLECFASSTPVNYFPAKNKVFDLFGNVWQWTETHIGAFHGFKPHPVYDDFSLPTFDGKHNCIKGGSWISAGNLAQKRARYAFRQHFYQHSGFRYVCGADYVNKKTEIFEADPNICEELDYSFSKENTQVHQLIHSKIDVILSEQQSGTKKALVLGCGAGIHAFKLSRSFDQVTGLDFSARNLVPATELQKTGFTRYFIKNSGEIGEYLEVGLEQLGIESQDGIEFKQENIDLLPDKYQGYDLIFSPFLFERLKEPKKFLAEVAGRLSENGIFVLLSSYLYQDQKLLGQKDLRGETLLPKEILKSQLAKSFDFVGESLDLNIVVKSQKRLKQLKTADLLIWKKNAKI